MCELHTSHLAESASSETEVLSAAMRGIELGFLWLLCLAFGPLDLR